MTVGLVSSSVSVGQDSIQTRSDIPQIETRSYGHHESKGHHGNNPPNSLPLSTSRFSKTAAYETGHGHRRRQESADVSDAKSHAAYQRRSTGPFTGQAPASLARVNERRSTGPFGGDGAGNTSSEVPAEVAPATPASQSGPPAVPVTPAPPAPQAPSAMAASPAKMRQAAGYGHYEHHGYHHKGYGYGREK